MVSRRVDVPTSQTTPSDDAATSSSVTDPTDAGETSTCSDDESLEDLEKQIALIDAEIRILETIKAKRAGKRSRC